ncbi:MAG: flagellar motor protein MotA [Betaproteobacteria bacterium HGW-Betaproteobacteria-1]|jgi:biopolymer transport protein ExbB|nr:MAG: flagellar motor protein MotA [Betaproteobacteria bacterium HGW-Betaproteobacteria-1]
MDAVPDIVDAVLIFLALLSLLIWTVGIAKFVAFYRNAGDDRQFLQAFAKATHVQELLGVMQSAKGRLARVCQSGLDELASWQRLAVQVPTDDKREMLLHALKQQSHIEQARMENGLSVLASVGSTAPFIGLFGTVWGIMNALKNISAAGSAGLDVVAGPIGEALIATAIGIATAVPAVLAYNYFLRKVRLSAATMDNFASAFHHLVLKSGARREP